MTEPAQSFPVKGAIVGAIVGAVAGTAVGLIVIVVLGFGLGMDLSGLHSYILSGCTFVGVLAGMFRALIGSSGADGA